MEHQLEYHDNGKVSEESWSVDGKLHREDGPALIEYYENGTIEKEEWYINGECHRLDGPAVVNYDEDGCVDTEEFYFDGTEVSYRDHEKLVAEILREKQFKEITTFYYDEDNTLFLEERETLDEDGVTVDRRLVAYDYNRRGVHFSDDYSKEQIFYQLSTINESLEKQNGLKGDYVFVADKFTLDNRKIALTTVNQDGDDIPSTGRDSSGEKIKRDIFEYNNAVECVVGNESFILYAYKDENKVSGYLGIFDEEREVFTIDTDYPHEVAERLANTVYNRSAYGFLDDLPSKFEAKEIAEDVRKIERSKGMDI